MTMVKIITLTCSSEDPEKQGANLRAVNYFRLIHYVARLFSRIAFEGVLIEL